MNKWRRDRDERKGKFGGDQRQQKCQRMWNNSIRGCIHVVVIIIWCWGLLRVIRNYYWTMIFNIWPEHARKMTKVLLFFSWRTLKTLCRFPIRVRMLCLVCVHKILIEFIHDVMVFCVCVLLSHDITKEALSFSKSVSWKFYD